MPKYKLPPLIFFESHADDSVTIFITNNLDYLVNVGYRTLCFEVESGETIENVLLQTRFVLPHLVNKLSHNRVTDPDYVGILSQVRAIVGKQWLFLHIKERGLSFRGVDMSVPEQLSQGNNSIERNEVISTNIVKTAQDCDGGIIVVTNLGRCIVQQMIAIKDNEYAGQYLSFHLHNPVYATNAGQELIAQYEHDGYKNHFPLGLVVSPITDENFLPRFKKLISDHCYAYEIEDLNTSSIIILKHIIGNEVSAHERTDGEKHVDAIFSLQKAAQQHHQDTQTFLDSLPTLLKGIQYEIQELHLHPSKTKEPHVIIRNINTDAIADSIASLKPN